MDFKERLIRNDMRHLADNLRTVSEELIVLQEFIQQEFAPQFRSFLRNRKNPINTAVVAIGAPPMPKIRKLDLNETEFDLEPEKTVRPSRKQRIKRETKPSKALKAPQRANNTIAPTEDDVEVFALYPETVDGNGGSDLNDNDDNIDGQFEGHSSDVEEYEVKNKPKWKAGVNSENEDNADEDFNPTVPNSEDDEPIADQDNDSDFKPSSVKSPKRKRKVARKETKSVKNDNHSVEKKEVSWTAYHGMKGSINITPFPPNCPICGVAIPNVTKLRRAHLSEHSEEEAIQNLICLICSHKFSDKDIFTRHMEKSHSEESPFKCCFCDKKVDSSHKLLEHERTHTGEKPFQCGICNDFFSRAFACKKHLSRTHKLSPSAINDPDSTFVRLVCE